MPGATSPDLSVFDAALARARRRRSPRVGGGRWSALAVAAAVLAGCTAEAEAPVPPPATTSSAEPSVDPTTTEPEPEPEPTGLVRPEAMNQGDDAGAIAAAEYYTLLGFESLRTSDTTEWEAVSGESCGFCAGIVADIVASAEAGATFVGGESELLGPGKIIGREETLGVIGVDVPYRVMEQTKYGADGAVEQTWPTSEAFLYLELAHGYEGWIIMKAGSHVEAYE